MEKYTFFWSGPFSQWNYSPFKINGIKFKTAEHYMMYKKATFFGDHDIAEKILKTDHPRDAKKLGRKVKRFDKTLWEEIAKKVVYDGSYEKFTQNPRLKEKLMDTDGTLLVEASPYDRIWGIGMAENDPGINDEKNWNGTNWLGEVLTQLREDFKKDGD